MTVLPPLSTRWWWYKSNTRWHFTHMLAMLLFSNWPSVNKGNSKLHYYHSNQSNFLQKKSNLKSTRTRLHSSRMRTDRRLTVSLRIRGGGILRRGWVSGQGVSGGGRGDLAGGGGYLARGCLARGGWVSGQGWGDVWSEGCVWPGSGATTPSINCGQNDRRLWKHNLPHFATQWRSVKIERQSLQRQFYVSFS